MDTDTRLSGRSLWPFWALSWVSRLQLSLDLNSSLLMETEAQRGGGGGLREAGFPALQAAAPITPNSSAWTLLLQPGLGPFPPRPGMDPQLRAPSRPAV